MAHHGQPPPPPVHIRPPGMFPGGQQRPQPPPGFRPQGPPGQGGPGPMQMHLPPKIIQQSARIRDITPQKVLTEADCLQKLTEFAAFSVRKVDPQHPGEKASWARAEVTEDRLDQADIKKAIKKLSVGKSVAEKRQALAKFQQGQVTALLDDLASKEVDRNFGWSLVQIDRAEKQVSGSSKSGKKAIETTVMNLYVKRAPLPGLNAVILYQQAEKRRLESLRPPPPPPQQPQPPPFHHERPPSAHGMRPQDAHGMRPQSAHGMRKGEQGPAFIEMNRQHQKSPRNRPQRRRYHDDSSSSGSSGSYDSESDSGSDVSSSLDTSVSSRSNHRHRRHSKGGTRSHSRHRPKYILEDHRRSPEPRPSDAYGVPHHQHPQHPPHPPYPQHPQQLHNPNPHQQQHPQIHQQHPPPQRPFVPDVPRMVPAMDPIHSAYQAGKEDARAEIGERSPVLPQPVVIERIIERPVIERPVIERPPIERVIERPPIEHIIQSPRSSVSYARLPERPRFGEPRYTDARYVDDGRRQDDEYFIRRREAEDIAIMREQRLRREAEDYMDQRSEPIGRRFSVRGDSPPARFPGREFLDRRPSDARDREYRRPEVRRVFTSPVEPHPFAQVPRRYPPSTSSASYGEPGW